METTIRIGTETKSELDQFRQYKNESYDEVVRKLIHLVKLTEKEPKLGQTTLKHIRDARARVKNGEYYTEEEARKILGKY